jgi:hypothetical protein
VWGRRAEAASPLVHVAFVPSFSCARGVGENPRSVRGEKIPQSAALLSSPIPFLLPNDDLSPPPNVGTPPLPAMEPDGDGRGGRPEKATRAGSMSRCPCTAEGGGLQGRSPRGSSGAPLPRPRLCLAVGGGGKRASGRARAFSFWFLVHLGGFLFRSYSLCFLVVFWDMISTVLYFLSVFECSV